MPQPVFFYDFNSPYAYLAARRIDEFLPGARWQPIAFAFILRATGRRPWSFGEEKPAGMRECEDRAARRGLPPIQWPGGWPVEAYSLLPLRAALVAEEHGRLREFSLAAFHEKFAGGHALTEIDDVLRAAEASGVDPGAIREGVEREDVKARLRDATQQAIDAGVPGVPAVLVDGECFWGDDRLEDAARSTGVA
jgi:2-hydroxychromene-2-carboxylate isomerase